MISCTLLVYFALETHIQCAIQWLTLVIDFLSAYEQANWMVQAKQELRPITSADFDAARQQVTPSTNPDSIVISELKQWNATYGESGNKAYRQHLSYFT